MTGNGFPENTRLIIWDVNGVLAPHDAAHFKATITAIAKLFREEHPSFGDMKGAISRLREKRRFSLSEFGKAIAEERDMSFDDIQNRFQELQGSEFITPSPELADEIADSTVRHAVLSHSGHSWIVGVLDRHNIGHHFKDAVFCVHDMESQTKEHIGEKSESPLPVQRVLEEINAQIVREGGEPITPDQVIMAEDTAKNLEPAHKMGVHTVLISGKSEKPGFVDQKFGSALEFISRFNGKEFEPAARSSRAETIRAAASSSARRAASGTASLAGGVINRIRKESTPAR
jgi:phosphoglycolate phosphatase-like HAD superfamily hydrolase